MAIAIARPAPKSRPDDTSPPSIKVPEPVRNVVDYLSGAMNAIRLSPAWSWHVWAPDHGATETVRATAALAGGGLRRLRIEVEAWPEGSEFHGASPHSERGVMWTGAVSDLAHGEPDAALYDRMAEDGPRTLVAELLGGEVSAIARAATEDPARLPPLGLRLPPLNDRHVSLPSSFMGLPLCEDVAPFAARRSRGPRGRAALRDLDALLDGAEAERREERLFLCLTQHRDWEELGSAPFEAAAYGLVLAAYAPEAPVLPQLPGVPGLVVAVWARAVPDRHGGALLVAVPRPA